MQQRAASSPEVYPPNFQGGHINITGGNFSQDNRRYKSSLRVDSRTFDNSTEFNGPVSGYIHRAKTTGPITGMQETNIGHKDQSLDAGVPRALVNIPLPISPIDQDERTYQIHESLQSPCRSPGDPPAQNRTTKRRKTKKLIPLTVPELLTGHGGEEHPSPSPRGHKIEEEFSQLSPEMQKFVESLESKKGLSQLSAAPRNPVSPQSRRRSQFPGHTSSNDGSYRW